MNKLRRLGAGNRVTPLLFLAFGFIVATGVHGEDAQIKAELERIRKAGEPTTGEELDKWYPRPVGQNAADILTNAFAKLKITALADSPVVPILGQANLPETNGVWPATVRSGASNALADNREALELLHQGVKISECRYPIDMRLGYKTLLPHLAGVRNSAKLMELESVLAADEGKTSKAVTGVIDILLISKSLRNEPELISQLVRVSCDSVACETLQWVINRRALPDEQLEKLADAFKRAQNPESLTKAYVGERVSGITVFQRPVKEIEDLFGKNSMARNFNSEDWNGDFNLYLETMKQLISASQANSEKSAKDAQAASIRVVAAAKGKWVVSSELIPPLAPAMFRYLNDIALLRCAETVIAVERYRRNHENLPPATLDELVPTFLVATPKDTYGSGVLIYEKLSGNGYKIASNSPKQKDRKPIAITIH